VLIIRNLIHITYAPKMSRVFALLISSGIQGGMKTHLLQSTT
jgi:hypothetical protein